MIGTLEWNQIFKESSSFFVAYLSSVNIAAGQELIWAKYDNKYAPSNWSLKLEKKRKEKKTNDNNEKQRG